MRVKIGLETHVQINTKSKIFCPCANPVNLKDEPEPNTLTCPTCLGMPGSKPALNRAVVEAGLKIALALNCKVAEEFFFSRKTYFYPDMSKNFQITQYEIPLSEKGEVMIKSGGKGKIITIKRVHLEEDPAKLTHVGGLGGKHVLVDYNRAGIPLAEIVTEPDFTSPEEARDYLNKLATILEYLGIYDPASSAVIKSDANVSIDGGQRVEVKNITGTKEIEQALKYEIVRQSNQKKLGKEIVQETRAWVPEISATQPLRSKETEEEYGYIFEPDLTMIEMKKDDIKKREKQLPEMPDRKYKRFLKEHKLPDKVAESLVSSPDTAAFFESVTKRMDANLAGRWIAGPLKKTLNWNSMGLSQAKLEEDDFVWLMKEFSAGRITDRNAELAIREMVGSGRSAKSVVKAMGLTRMEGAGEIEKVVEDVVKKNGKAVDDYRAGEEKSLFFLVGQVMKESRGRIDAKEAAERLRKLISG